MINFTRLIDFVFVQWSLVGLTLISMNFGSESLFYLIGMAVVGLLSIKYWIFNRTAYDGNLLLFILLASVVFFFQLISLNLNLEDLLRACLAFLALIVVLSASRAFSIIDDSRRKYAIEIAFLILIISCTLNLILNEATKVSVGEYRFSGGGFRESVWAEIALGLLVMSLIVGKRYAIYLALVFVLFVSQITDIRTAKAIAIITLSIIIFGEYWNKYGKNVSLVAKIFLFLIVSIITISYLYGAILDWIVTQFKLEDSHRGIESGFSGRYGNVMAGIDIFFENILLGAGVNNEIAGYSHNGFVKVSAEYGILWLIFILIIFFSPVRFLVKNGSLYNKLAWLIFLMFLMAQPRHFNFQLFPLVGWFYIFAMIQYKLNYNMRLKKLDASLK